MKQTQHLKEQYKVRAKAMSRTLERQILPSTFPDLLMCAKFMTTTIKLLVIGLGAEGSCVTTGFALKSTGGPALDVNHIFQVQHLAMIFTPSWTGSPIGAVAQLTPLQMKVLQPSRKPLPTRPGTGLLSCQ